jgi:SRSO17 transposase
MASGWAGQCGRSRPDDHVCVTTTKSRAAAAARIAVGRVRRVRADLVERLRPCFVRTQTWQQATKYMSALASDLPKRNGWTIAEHVGDRGPDRTQRLLNRAVWDAWEAMSLVRRFVVEGLGAAARRRRGLVVGALDETGQAKRGVATCGVKRQYMGCAGRVDNGINTVHLSYVRQGVGHALIGARQWIPAEQIDDTATARSMGLPDDAWFRTKGQLAIDVCADAYADGVRFDVVCGDEVYGGCTQLRGFFEHQQQAYVLRVASTFMLDLGGGLRLSCRQAVDQLVSRRGWQVRSAGTGSKGQRWYAWALIATSSPRHLLLVRRHLRTGELAFHYCHAPEPQRWTMTRLIHAAGLRWPVEEDFEFGKDHFGLDQCQARLYTAILRHTVLVMATLAVCAVAAAQLRDRTNTQTSPPTSPDQVPPPDPGLIPLTIPETRRLLSRTLHHPKPPDHAEHWTDWRRRHQARARWFHQRTRLGREYALVT